MTSNWCKSGWLKTAAIVLALSTCAIRFYGLAFGAVVLNGTKSLPQSGFFMVRWPKVIIPGSYVAFTPPEGVKEEYQQFVFVKRIAGVTGDRFESGEGSVCINGTCRELLPELLSHGFLPPQSEEIATGHFAAFGDSADSLDSRYGLIGQIPKESVVAVGFPIPIPHWKDIRSWLKA